MKNFFTTKAILLSVLILSTTSITAQVQKGLDIDGEALGDESGTSVSMPDANTVAIGAPFNNGPNDDNGHVRVYEWVSGSWIQKGSDIDGESTYDKSGSSVSMPDANTVAIGAVENDGNGNYAGHVRVYEWSGTQWVQKGGDLDSEASFDRFGSSVSMPDANTVAIGAIANDANGLTNSGHVRIFEWNGSQWVQKGLDLDGEASDDQFGYSVSMPSANTVAIGAPYHFGGFYQSGYVRIFEWDGNQWIQKGIDIDGAGSTNFSGSSVSMPDDNTLAVGAYRNNGNNDESLYRSGHVRIFSWNGTTWEQKGVDIDGESVDDFSGFSVSMPDANTVAIGAIQNQDAGTDAGHVRIYRWDGTQWYQQGLDIDGEDADDQSGYSVSMPDATTVAIGAPFNWGANGQSSGHTRVYSICMNTASSINESVCGSYVVPSGDETYTMSGIYKDTIPNMAGCDSVITIDLTILNATTGVDLQTACDSYTWIDGITYTSSNNTATHTLTNAAGCDSVVTLELTVKNSSTGVDLQTACDSYTWIDGNTYMADNNTATHTLTNAAGCDSIVTLDLTINNSSTGVDLQTACDSYTWIDGNTYTSSNNTATYTLTNAAGCDSVVTLDLTINTVNTSVTNNSPTLTATASGATYQWLDCDNAFEPINGETSQAFTAISNGSYAVEITENGCKDTSNCEVVNNVGLENFSDQQLLAIYPNPTTGKVTVHLGKEYKDIKLTVLNSLGQVIAQKEMLSATVFAFEIGGARGVYLIKVETEQGLNIIKRVIKD